MSQSDLDRHPLTGRFLMGRLRHAMSEKEKDLLESLVEETERVPRSKVLLRRGDVSSRSTMLIEGFVLRTMFEEGRRYIVGIHIPGDFVDLHAFALKKLDHDIISLGEVRLGYVSHERLEKVVEQAPHLTRLLWFSSLLDAAIHRQWIVTLEKLTAVRRVAHVFCAIWARLDMVGLGRSDGLRTPLIQADLAEMCGTTAIHMNRALRQLKDLGLAEFRRGAVFVPDRKALEKFCDFDPAYLYGEGELRLQHELDAGRA